MTIVAKIHMHGLLFKRFDLICLYLIDCMDLTLILQDNCTIQFHTLTLIVMLRL